MTKEKLVVIKQSNCGTSTPFLNSPEPFFTMEDGHAFTELWYSNSNMATDSIRRDYQDEFSFNIPAGATRFIRCKFPPFRSVKLTAQKYGEENLSPDSFALHNATTIDFGVVTKGKMNLITENESVLLNTGDCIVQQATIHSWVNPTDETAEMIFVMVGVSVSPSFKQKNLELSTPVTINFNLIHGKNNSQLNINQ